MVVVEAVIVVVAVVVIGGGGLLFDGFNGAIFKVVRFLLWCLSFARIEIVMR